MVSLGTRNLRGGAITIISTILIGIIFIAIARDWFGFGTPYPRSLGVGVLILFLGPLIGAVVCSKGHDKRKNGKWKIKEGKRNVLQGEATKAAGEKKTSWGKRQVQGAKKALAALRPERKIAFISKIHVPFYLVPHNKGAIVSDGLFKGEMKEIDVVNIDTRRLNLQYRSFQKEHGRYVKLMAEKPILPFNKAAAYDSAVIDLHQPETKIIDLLKQMKTTLSKRNWRSKRTEINLHHPKSKAARTIRRLYPYRHKGNGEPIIPVSVSLSRIKKTVNELHGIQHALGSSTICSVLDIRKRNIEKDLAPIEQQLNEAEKTLHDHYRQFHGLMKRASKRYVCADCLKIKKRDDGYDDYDMRSYIHNRFSLSIDLLSKESYGGKTSTYQGALSAIQERIELSLNDARADPFMRAKYQLAQLSAHNDSYYCPDHASATRVVGNDYFAPQFAATGTALWKAISEPVRHRAYAENERAMHLRDNFKLKMLNILPYSQIVTELTIHRNDLETSLLEAKRVLSAIEEEYHV